MSFYIILTLLINLVLLFMSLFIINSSFSRIYIYSLLAVSFLIIYNSIFINFSDLNIFSIYFITLSNFFVFLTSILLKCKSTNNSLKFYNKLNLEKPLIYRFYIFAIISLLLLFFGIGSIDRILSSWIDVKDELQGQSFYRVLSTIFFFLSLAELRKLHITKKSKFISLLPGILLLMLFILILRVKMFIIPLFFIFIIPSDAEIKLKNLLKVSFYFPVLYIFVMFFRWLGSFDNFSIDKAGSIFSNVIEAGIEREMFDQYHSVFDYYFNQKSNTDLGGSYLKIITEPFARLFNFASMPNPMYKYHNIFSNGRIFEGGSAHPSVYGDSFASFGFLGLLIPSIYLIIIYTYVESFIHYKNSILFVGASLSLALIVRGSTYYGILYFIVIFIIYCLNSLLIRLKK